MKAFQTFTKLGLKARGFPVNKSNLLQLSSVAAAQPFEALPFLETEEALKIIPAGSIGKISSPKMFPKIETKSVLR